MVKQKRFDMTKVLGIAEKVILAFYGLMFLSILVLNIIDGRQPTNMDLFITIIGAVSYLEFRLRDKKKVVETKISGEIKMDSTKLIVNLSRK